MSRTERSQRHRLVVAGLAVGVLCLLAVPAGAQTLPPSDPSQVPDGDTPGQEVGIDDPCADERLVLQPGCRLMEGVVGGIGGVVQGGASAALRAMTEWVVEAASWLLTRLAELIDATTRPDVGSGWFQAAYGQMTVLAATLMLPLLLLSVVQALLRSNGAQLARIVFVYVPVAMLGMFAATAVTQMLLRVTDELSAGVSGSVGADLTGFAADLAAALAATTVASATTTGLGVPGFAGLLGGLLVGLAVLVIWVLLALRQAAVYAGVLFLPLAFAGLVWPATASWFKRLVEGLVAIIFSKFVIVAVLAMATSALAAIGVTDGFQLVVTGGSLLLLAVFAPFVLLRMIPVFGSELASSLDGVTRSPTSPVPVPSGRGMYRQIANANRARMATATAGAGAGPGGLLIAGGAAAAGAGSRGAAKVKSAAEQTGGHGTPPTPPTPPAAGGGTTGPSGPRGGTAAGSTGGTGRPAGPGGGASGGRAPAGGGGGTTGGSSAGPTAPAGGASGGRQSGGAGASPGRAGPPTPPPSTSPPAGNHKPPKPPPAKGAGS